MKEKLKAKARAVAQNPAARNALCSMKPEKSLWGFLGVAVFLILPEIVAFIWGGEIAAYAKAQLPHAASSVERQYYDLLVMLFGEGGSWVNLAIGIALLVWLFF
ncbi:hypothetical protein E0765_05870 [Sulfuricurvum sp. IAE1]|uniref:hypothetical protein n=1 Tax=Sulfuricurvum sp. IAE1 TaxID=2546102 RepID=UPI0010446B51|nr:hypothetical protein [Sulfuricurvum sp. IAE1]TDA64238.1 hypothetical protein E0765_05870 [Sulfuricurvum sp. IAE1]